ncbi:Protein hairless [Bienertia sinuspersici]
MKKLEQQKVREISLMDEKIYAKTKLKGRRRNRIVLWDECEKLQKEVDKAMNEDNEAKKEAVSRQ